MRVLWVLHTPRDERSGVYVAVRSDAAELIACGHEVEILVPTDLLAPRFASARLVPLLYPMAARRWIRRQPPFDVLIFHSISGWASALGTGGAASGRGPLFVTQFHGLEPIASGPGLGADNPKLSRLHVLYRGYFLKWLLAMQCRKSHQVLCLNERERGYLVEHRWAAADRVAIVHPWVPDAFLAARSAPSTARKIVFVGQWMGRKGVRPLARAFADLAARYEDLGLICAGTRISPEEVRRAFPEAFRSRIDVFPEVKREQLSGLLAEATVFVLPSFFEGSSVALREAMAVGVPIVTTPAGAAPDFLREGESALFVPFGDAEAIVAAVERFLADPELSQRCGRGARAVAEDLNRQPGLADLLENLVCTSVRRRK